jgi:hypothetical protein
LSPVVVVREAFQAMRPAVGALVVFLPLMV